MFALYYYKKRKKMRVTFLLVYAIFSTTVVRAYTKPVIQKVQKIDYKKALNLSNEYAMKGNVKSSLKYAKIAYRLRPTKEALYSLARIYAYEKNYKLLNQTASLILKKNKNDYLGLKYKTSALIGLKQKEAVNFAKKGVKHYGEEFEKLLDKAYELV